MALSDVTLMKRFTPVSTFTNSLGNPLLSTLLHITLGVVVRDENVARIWSYEGTWL